MSVSESGIISSCLIDLAGPGVNESKWDFAIAFNSATPACIWDSSSPLR